MSRTYTPTLRVSRQRTEAVNAPRESWYPTDTAAYAAYAARIAAIVQRVDEGEGWARRRVVPGTPGNPVFILDPQAKRTRHRSEVRERVLAAMTGRDWSTIDELAAATHLQANVVCEYVRDLRRSSGNYGIEVRWAKGRKMQVRLVRANV